MNFLHYKDVNDIELHYSNTLYLSNRLVRLKHFKYKSKENVIQAQNSTLAGALKTHSRERHFIHLVSQFIFVSSLQEVSHTGISSGENAE